MSRASIAYPAGRKQSAETKTLPRCRGSVWPSGSMQRDEPASYVRGRANPVSGHLNALFSGVRSAQLGCANLARCTYARVFRLSEFPLADIASQRSGKRDCMLRGSHCSSLLVRDVEESLRALLPVVNGKRKVTSGGLATCLLSAERTSLFALHIGVSEKKGRRDAPAFRSR